MSFVPERRHGPELIDLPPESYSQSEYAGSLADIRKVNRLLGDNRATLKFFSALVSGIDASAERPLKVLDVATGSADIPVEIVKWARRQGIKVVLTAVDINSLSIREAAALTRAYPEITVAVADGFSLPFEDGSFDIILCAKTLHHFSEEDMVRLLKEMDRVAATAYIIMDLRRSWMAWLLIYIFARIFSRNRLTRHDGPMSVLRSFTVTELVVLADKAGFAGHRVMRQPFWLMVLSGRKG
ncbi:MAG: methyltransferase domain-containing protein [Nitrospiraceae bacterium]|nr:MAG: methyltransferase domain-containing protein [Nitrospiraceae bacterium]